QCALYFFSTDRLYISSRRRHTRQASDRSSDVGFSDRLDITTPLNKIEAIRETIVQRGLKVEIEVDGGIDRETARHAVGAGATALVAGTSVFRGGPAAYADNIRALRGDG